MDRIVLLAEGLFTPFDAKTAMGVLRYREPEVVAVVDSSRRGTDAATALGMDLGRGVPVVGDVAESLAGAPDTLVIGITPGNDRLYPRYRQEVLAAVDAGLDIHSGLHFRLGEDPEIAAAASSRGVRLWDVRRPPETRRVARYLAHRPGSHTVLAVGSDGSAGKMTTMLELHRAARSAGWRSAFLATGQTGILIDGDGVPADSVVSDFLAGAIEEKVVALAERADWTFVEGQGALNHPAYSAVTLGIMHGALPEALILCHIPGSRTINGWPDCPMPPLERIVRMNEDAAGWLRPRGAPVVGISLLTLGMSDHEAVDSVRRTADATGLPTTDVVRFGADTLLAALERHRAETERRRAGVTA
jgi:uncharacterized NAD-dependent epimerase/dehydratase family protein